MTTTTPQLPWWKEPTKGQWASFSAAWIGWVMDAFDFTIFLLVMKQITEEFHVSYTSTAGTIALTLLMRLAGAMGAGWAADHAFGGYYMSYSLGEGVQGCGFSVTTSRWLGATLGFLYETYVEVEDGYGAQWGFSPTDFAGDFLGGAYFMAQHYVPALENFNLQMGICSGAVGWRAYGSPPNCGCG